MIAEARTLRILRAVRAQEPGLLPPAVASDPEAWFRECAVAERIVADLSERAVPDGSPASVAGVLVDGRRGAPLDVLDLAVLAPFVDAVQAAIERVVVEMDPTRLVFEALEPAVLSRIYPSGIPAVLLSKGVGPGEVAPSDPLSSKRARGSDPGHARRAAIKDASVLAWETVLFEVVHRVQVGNDRRRAFNRGVDLSDLVVGDATVTRTGRLKAEAARRKADRIRARRVEAGLEEARPGSAPKSSPFDKPSPVDKPSPAGDPTAKPQAGKPSAKRSSGVKPAETGRPAEVEP